MVIETILYVSDVNATLETLQAVEVSLENLTLLGQQLHDNLTELQVEIIKTLESTHCSSSICSKHLSLVKALKMEANFSQVSRVTKTTLL